MKWRNILAAVLLCTMIGVTACDRKATQPNTPEGTLEKYVAAAFEVRKVEDRQKLLDLSTGDAKSHLENMNADDFKRNFLDSKLRFISMKTKDLRQEKDGDVSLVYELSFQDGSGTPAPTTHTNRKIAYLTRDEAGNWKIKSTKNIKTVIEKKEDLVITPEAAAQ